MYFFKKNKQHSKYSINLLIFLFSFFMLSGNCIAEVHKDTTYDRYLNHFITLKNAKEYLLAEKVISKAISKYPYSAQFYYLRGKLRHYFLPNFEAAIGDYSKAIAFDAKSFPTSYWRRGFCLYSLGHYDLAIRDFNNCLKLTPGNYKVYLMRAKAFAKLGMTAYAIKDLQTIMKKDPTYYKIAQNLMNKIFSGDNNF